MFLSILSYIIFFAGILISPNIYVGFFFSFICGFGNTCLDSGGTPALMEILNKMMGTASILTKLFIAAGQFILPVVIGVVVARQMYYGTSFLLCIGVLIVLGVCLIRVPFVSVNETKCECRETENRTDIDMPKGNMRIEGIALIIIGYTSTATFHTIINWITIYAREVAKLSETTAQSLMSFYSTGAVIAVAATAFLVQKLVKPVRMLIVYPVLATAAMTILMVYPTEMVCRIMAFAIGCFAGGGVLQLAAAAIVEFFPEKKATVTGMVFTASGVAMFLGPIITGFVSKISVSYVLVYDIAVTLLGILLAIVVNIRYNQVFSKKTER